MTVPGGGVDARCAFEGGQRFIQTVSAAERVAEAEIGGAVIGPPFENFLELADRFMPQFLKGLVIGNDGSNFSVGANIGRLCIDTTSHTGK